MTAETITPNDDGIAECDNYGAVSSRPLAECDHTRQLDHIDTMLHEVLRKVGQLDPLVPLIPRALALLDPGAAMRRSFGRKRGSDAVQELTPAPLHVREASPDSGPVGA